MVTESKTHVSGFRTISHLKKAQLRRKALMSEQKRQTETPVVKKWSEMTPQEKEATENRLKEKLRKYYEGRPSREAIRASMGEDLTE